MGLKNFVTPGYYTKIARISVDTESDTIDFTIIVKDGKNGENVLNPIPFHLKKETEQNRYLDEHPPELPVTPEYPKLCSDREVMVPMWTEKSTDDEKKDYNDARQGYLNSVVEYKARCKTLLEDARSLAAINNAYDLFFSDEKMYESGNPIKCAYNFLKAQKGFGGVEDDE